MLLYRRDEYVTVTMRIPELPHTYIHTRDATRHSRTPAIYVTRCHRRAASTRLVNERGAFRLLFAIHVTARAIVRASSHHSPLAKLCLHSFLRYYFETLRELRLSRPARLDRAVTFAATFMANIQRYVHSEKRGYIQLICARSNVAVFRDFQAKRL